MKIKTLLSTLLATVFVISCSTLPISAANSDGAGDITALEKFANDNDMKMQVMEKSEKTKDFIDFDTVEKAEQYLKALKDSLSVG